MRFNRKGVLSTAVLAATAVLAMGCGEVTIRTWVNIIEEESGGYMEIFNNGVPQVELDMLRLQGGFLTETKLNLATLPNPMLGTIELVDVRMAGEVENIGNICTWNDPEGVSGGSIVVDLFGGNTETEIFLDAKATTVLNDLLDVPPIDFEEYIEMDLGGSLGIDQFMAAFNAGTPEGLFATESNIAAEIVMGPATTIFAMNTVVTNGALPPVFDADLAEFCADEFATQGFGNSSFYAVNAKSSYMRSNGNDVAQEPLVIPLDEVGAVPGDTLHLATVGTYAPLFALQDGVETRLGGVFSSTDEILADTELFRIPGAIDAGANENTWLSIFCWFGECTDMGGDDIGEDFRINPALNIAVPPGAEFLVVAPIDFWRTYGDNTGMGFGLTVEVLE